MRVRPVYLLSLLAIGLLVSGCQKDNPYVDDGGDLLYPSLEGIARLADVRHRIPVRMACTGACGDGCPEMLVTFDDENGIDLACPCAECYPGLSPVDTSDTEKASHLGITLKPRQTAYLREYFMEKHGTDRVFVPAFEYYPGFAAEALLVQFRTTAGGTLHQVLLVTGLPRIGAAMPIVRDALYVCTNADRGYSDSCRPVFDPLTNEVSCSGRGCRLETHSYSLSPSYEGR